jgi:predicted nucleic acid-binding protein
MSIPRSSEFSWLWQGFIRGEFILFYTTEILNEYFEILSHYYSPLLAENVTDVILNAKNAVPITIYYNWHLITADPDDDKFVDCALMAGADYIITYDKHFNVLRRVDFPKIKVINIEDFQKTMFPL